MCVDLTSTEGSVSKGNPWAEMEPSKVPARAAGEKRNIFGMRKLGGSPAELLCWCFQEVWEEPSCLPGSQETSLFSDIPALG